MDCTRPKLSPTRKTLASSEVSNPTSRLSLCTLGKSPRTWARAPGANLAAQPEAAVICVSLMKSSAIDPSSHRSIFSSQYTHGGAASGRRIATPTRRSRRDKGTVPLSHLSTNQMNSLGIEVHAQGLVGLRQLVGSHAHLVDLPLQTRGCIDTWHVQQHQPLKARIAHPGHV